MSYGLLGEDDVFFSVHILFTFCSHSVRIRYDPRECRIGFLPEPSHCKKMRIFLPPCSPPFTVSGERLGLRSAADPALFELPFWFTPTRSFCADGRSRGRQF